MMTFYTAPINEESKFVEHQFTSWDGVATFLASSPLVTTFAQFCIELDQALLEQGEASIRMVELDALAELWYSV